MDAIEQLDWGVYSHFRFQDQKYDFLSPLMQDAYYLSSYIGVSILLSIAVILFLLMRKWRSALVGLISFAVAIGLIETVQWLVPRQRPGDADRWLGSDNMVGSYPSASVFLFMLVMILIGYAVMDLTRQRWLRGLYILTAGMLTVWVCLSQFFLSTNFLTDVLGGMAGATLVSWFAYRFLDREAQAIDHG